MTDNRKRIHILVGIISVLCVIGIIGQLSVIDKWTELSGTDKMREFEQKSDLPENNSVKEKYATPKAIRSKVDALLSKARAAKDANDFESVVDCYYDAVILEPEILQKWNKKRYIGAEMDIIKTIHKDPRLLEKTGDKSDKQMKTNYILSQLYKGCKKNKKNMSGLQL